MIENTNILLELIGSKSNELFVQFRESKSRVSTSLFASMEFEIPAQTYYSRFFFKRRKPLKKNYATLFSSNNENCTKQSTWVGIGTDKSMSLALQKLTLKAGMTTDCVKFRFRLMCVQPTLGPAHNDRFYDLWYQIYSYLICVIVEYFFLFLNMKKFCEKIRSWAHRMLATTYSSKGSFLSLLFKWYRTLFSTGETFTYHLGWVQSYYNWYRTLPISIALYHLNSTICVIVDFFLFINQNHLSQMVPFSFVLSLCSLFVGLYFLSFVLW